MSNCIILAGFQNLVGIFDIVVVSRRSKKELAVIIRSITLRLPWARIANLSCRCGWSTEEIMIGYDLKNDDGIIQNTITYFHRLRSTEIELEFNNKPTSRYCLAEAIPETGRMHLLRKHFKHIFHPILGSRPHGCNKQNKLWLENFELKGIMLHAHQIN